MMREDVLAYCLVKPGAWQDEPWDGDVVAKVGEVFLRVSCGDPSVLRCGNEGRLTGELAVFAWAAPRTVRPEEFCFLTICLGMFVT